MNSINKHTHSEKVFQTPFAKTCECKKVQYKLQVLIFLPINWQWIQYDASCIFDLDMDILKAYLVGET